MNVRKFCRFFVLCFLVCAKLGGARAQTAPPITTTPIFSDDFAAPQLDLGKWDIEGTNNDLQRTQWGKKPILARDADGTNFLRVPLSSFNPNYGKTGTAMLGTQVGSRDAFGVGAGIEYEARIRSNHLPPGLVLGYFAYNSAGVWQDSYQKTEIDFEFITKLASNTILFNIWDNWNPLRGGPKSGTYPVIPGLDWNNNGWNTFKVRWYPGRTEWLINGVIYRVETLVKPGSAMRVMFNLWAPSSDWPSAFDANLLVAPTPAQNRDYFYDVDYVRVRPIPNTGKALIGTGTGLSATYFDNPDFTNPKLGRRDQRVDFNWGSVAPDPKMGADTFSVRWSGFVQPQFSESYTFSTLSDDGVRLYVNNKLVIDRWVNQGTTELSSAKILLQAGVKVPIRLEYFDGTGEARVHLLWSSASTPKTLIPQSQLYVLAQPAKPVFSIPAGTYSGVQNVAITSATSGATIRYTLDGSDPDAQSSILSAGQALRFTYTQILRATAFVSGQVPSEIASAHYVIADVTPPTLAITSPTPSAQITALNLVAGTVSDAGSGVSHVDLVITRVSDGTRWNGSSWVPREAGITTNLNGNLWSLNTALPKGADLKVGDYQLKAVAYDYAGLISSAVQKISVIPVVDVSGPILSLSFPANGAVISDFSGIAGTARDELNAVAKVGVVIRRVSDGARWNGWEWLSGYTGIGTQLVGTNWKVVVPAANGAGLPTGSWLLDGQYEIYATGTDTLGNYSSISVLVTRKSGVSTATSARISSAPRL